ncbi:MAG: peptidase C1 [candidate division Zixibacteria bacterium]|nr:peptidase C1 [candidate division Zixibacteria bacterium]
MIRTARIISFGFMLSLLPAALAAQTDTVKYVPRYHDPVLEEIRVKDSTVKAEEDSVTSKIRETQRVFKDAEEKKEKTLRFDVSKIVRPASPEAFKPAFHFPPVRQYMTSTCWSFSTTSFMESEVYRLTGQKIKLSEMFTVYHEFIEKARYFLRQRGEKGIPEGGESNGLLRIIRQYGAVPEEAYSGTTDPDGRHDHDRMFRELSDYLEFVKDHDMWDEEEALAGVRAILNKYMGAPPEAVTWGGKTMTPREFATDVLRLNPDDYVDLVSTLAEPFYAKIEFKVEDNWWHDSSYYNVPLAEWYAVLKQAVQNGYTVAIGGDVSEPGMYGFEDLAVVPDFDIPQKYINQHSREFRIANETTGDDHGIHVVGMTRAGGRDWFLIKDSGSSSNWGRYKGYYFYRDDFIRLKMLGYQVHKDAVAELLKKFDK